MHRLLRIALHPVRLAARPVRRLAVRIREASQRRKYGRADGYDAARYWRDRHSRYGFDLRGVGNKGLSDAENRRAYEEAGGTFVALCREAGVRFETARMLDVGCGTGFYAGVFRDRGGRDYTGVDIADVLLPELRERYPDFRFRQQDVTSEPLEEEFDLIAMIDVTQHITDPAKFSFAMRNLRAALAPSGTLILTSWLDEEARRSYYEVSRSIDRYAAELDGCTIGEPVPFRDKFMFAVRKDS